MYRNQIKVYFVGATRTFSDLFFIATTLLILKFGCCDIFLFCFSQSEMPERHMGRVRQNFVKGTLICDRGFVADIPRSSLCSFVEDHLLEKQK